MRLRKNNQNKIGNKMFNQKDYQSSLINYTNAIAFDPYHYWAYHNRSLSKSRLGNHKSAIDDANKALGVKPLWGTAYTRRGDAKNDLGQKILTMKYNVLIIVIFHQKIINIQSIVSISLSSL